MRFPISLHPQQPCSYLSFFFLIIAILVQWCFIAILVLISLMAYDAEHLFMCLLTTYITSLEKCLFRSLTHILIRLCIFCKKFLLFWKLSSLSWWCLCSTKVLIIFFFCCLCFWCTVMHHLLKGICSKRCVIRWFYQWANTTECTYTN